MLKSINYNLEKFVNSISPDQQTTKTLNKNSSLHIYAISENYIANMSEQERSTYLDLLKTKEAAISGLIFNFKEKQSLEKSFERSENCSQQFDQKKPNPSQLKLNK